MSTPDTMSATTASLETTLAGWEARLARVELLANLVLKAAKLARKAAAEGAVAAGPAMASGLRDSAARLTEAIAEDAPMPAIDLADLFETGAYVQELSRAAAAANVTLVQRDGRITAYPVVLRLDPRAGGVKIGRKLVKQIRPAFLAAQLKKIQARPNRFNARSFLDRVLKVYAVLAPDWSTGEGPLIALAAIHDLLTLMPAAAADYPVEEFLVDLLRLDRDPDARTGRGHRFELGGSTGTKGAKRLTVYDETGAQHDYYAIRFAIHA